MNISDVFIMSLPMVFMLHDFEEIIGMKSWVNTNRDYIQRKFPRLAPQLLNHLDGISTSGFAVGVAVMFLLVSASSFISVVYGQYYLWMGVFMAYSLHCVIHVVQWIIFRRYVPVIVTSLLSIPYCAYGVMRIADNFGVWEIVLWSSVGLGVMGVSLPLVHKLMGRLKLQ